MLTETGVKARLLVVACLPVLLLGAFALLFITRPGLPAPLYVLAVLLVLVVAVGLSLLVAWEIQRAVNGMIATLDRLSRSDFAARVDMALPGPTEVRRLAAAINAAADMVQHNRAQLLRQMRQARRRLKRTVAALRRSEQTYRDLFENATDIVFTTDLSGRFLEGNRAVQRLLGYTVDEAKHLDWERLVAADHMQRARQMFRRHARGERQISFELDVTAKSGGVRTFEIGSRPMYEQGRLAGFHGIARDITERVRMQRDLVEARRVAEDASRAKSTFLANMSHEIRTPINGVLGYTRLLTETELSAQQREYLEPLEASARHLLKIINDILDLSKIEAGHIEIVEEVIDPGAVVRSAVDLLRPLAQAKGLALRLQLADRLPARLIGDGTRIGQVVGNLVNNAVKFTSCGRVTVAVDAAPCGGNRWMLRCIVEDTGIGIPGGAMTRILEPFQQSDNRTTRRYEGTGLGLTITKDLVRAMAGELTLESESGRYTRASVTLPLRSSSAAAGEEAGDREAGCGTFSGGDMRMLVVDDNVINRRFLCAMLRRYGCRVDAVSSGAEAVRVANRGYDLVLMDIHMADMDGFEATRRIRAAHGDAPPVIAVSADVMGDVRRRCEAGELDGFVAKPVMEDALLDLLGGLFPGRYSSAGDVPADHGRPRRTRQVLDRELGIDRASGDAELWRSSVVAFRDALPAAAADLASARAAQDYEALGAHAHKLAGSAEYLAADPLALSLRELERAARTGACGRIGECLQRVAEEISAFEELEWADR
jgi:PAS domain S-box-containing protein